MMRGATHGIPDRAACVHTGSARASTTFLLLTAALACCGFAWCLWIAGRQWFVGDDFAFLLFAKEPRGWLHVFLPLRARIWWSYRPLTTTVFFSLGLWIFGLSPFGYLVMSLLAHFLTGLVVYRLARQFDFDFRVAAVTAVLSVFRYPSLTEGFWISVSQYTITLFFFAVSVSLFIDYARSSRRIFQVASCSALVLTLLSNEAGVALAGVIVLASLYVDEFSLSRCSVMRTVRRVVPQVVLTGAYVVLRTEVVAPAPVPPLYQWTLGWQIPYNYGWALRFAVDNQPVKLLAGGALLVAALVTLATAGPLRRGLSNWFLRMNLLGWGWIAAAMLPYVALPLIHPRFAMCIEVPVCLLLGACLNVCYRVYADKHATALEMAFLGILVASVPYGALREQANSPKGEPARQFVELLRENFPDVQRGTTVVLRYGANGLATPSEAEEFSFRIFGGFALGPFYAEKTPGFRLVDSSKPLPTDLQCPPCVFLELKPGLSLRLADSRS